MPEATNDAPADETFLFTVFTATWNRAHTLDRPFQSLVQQTFRDFEWVIVDNGSTDGTPELVEQYRAQVDFPIRYFWQENAGKHVSANRGVKTARGRLFVTLDSDDACIPTALERLRDHWDAFTESERETFVGVTGLCRDQDGNLVGTMFPADPTDSNSSAIRYRYKVKGEKWGFQQTRILRDHLFPEPPGFRGLIPPTIVWMAIARRYKTRYVNEALHVWWLDQAVRLSNPADRVEEALGAMLESESILSHDMRYFSDAPMDFVVMAIKFTRSCLHQGRGFPDQWRALRDPRARALWFATLPAGLAAYFLERAGLQSIVRRIRMVFA